MRFEEVGFDPIDGSSPLNIVEQLNQSFTYIASVKAVKTLLTLHPDLVPFTLNLGTQSGSDIESGQGGGVAAEVFAAVRPSNNNKLQKDIAKVALTDAQYKYVFFMAPGFEEGRRRELESNTQVLVWSLGVQQSV